MKRKIIIFAVVFVFITSSLGITSLFAANREFKMGDTGDEVKLIQQKLTDSGFELKKYGVDGVFGKETRQAVIEFQKYNGLTPSGIVDAATLKALKLSFDDETPTDNPNSISGTEYYKVNLTIDEALDKQVSTSWLNVKWVDGSWPRASRSDIRKYLDPSNYTKDPVLRYQFVVLDNNPTIKITSQNEARITKDLEKLLSGKGVFDGKATAFVEAAKSTNLALPYLVAHSALETGWGTSQLAKGVDGYHNVYGICAYDNDAVGEGIKKAKIEGWDSVEKAIIGGAKYLKENTMTKKQRSTLYKMRWWPQNPVNNQYATDIGWAVKQCQTYKKLFDLFPEAKLKFQIPKYN